LITEQIFSCKTSTYVPKIPPWVGNWVGGSRETSTPGSPRRRSTSSSHRPVRARIIQALLYLSLLRPRSGKTRSLIRNERLSRVNEIPIKQAIAT
jgi:hypothetical protein